jgi:hypothetical protein
MSLFGVCYELRSPEGNALLGGIPCLSVFSAPINNTVYNIVWFQFWGGLTNNEHIWVSPGSGPSGGGGEPYIQRVDIE